jgi:hypothetical protein
VTFTANATGGSAITGYTVTSSPGNISASGASSPIVVTGLTNGTAYTFTVVATNANGSSAVSSASNSITPVNNVSVDYLVIAGGGSGGDYHYGGGGGAGGYLTSTSYTLTGGQQYNITVGAGGTYPSGGYTNGNSGNNSTFATLTAIGGGGGGSVAPTNGLNGGSGGGAGGSGISIIRYQSATQKATGGTIVSSGGYYYHTFTATDAFISSVPKATGGTITASSGYWYHTFTSTADFTPTVALTADVLMVAGGGGGGANHATSGSGGQGIVIIRYPV